MTTTYTLNGSGLSYFTPGPRTKLPFVYPLNTIGIKKGDVVFRDRRTKLDSGYFLVEGVIEIPHANSNPPNQVETRIEARKIAYRDGKPCKGKLRSFAINTCVLVDINYIETEYRQEIDKAAQKRFTLNKILEEIRDLNI